MRVPLSVTCGLIFLWLISTDIINITAAARGPKFEGFETITEVVNKSYRFQFKTCANSGRHGPTQYQCDRTYEFTDINITVLKEPPFEGVQVWTVPKTALYSITALGASGGKGVGNTEVSKGGYVSGKFNLTKGEQIRMLIGQQGQSACEETNDQIKPLCKFGLLSQGNKKMVGGGGGGGGGTFVFKIDPESKKPIPLLVAGGGGGKGLSLGPSPFNTDGGLLDGGPGYSANTFRNGPGGGGGWRGQSNLSQAGGSLLFSGTGGSTCPPAIQQMGWQTSGGYGGGGGGCSSGGGGGGYSGGNISLANNPEHNGMGGSSFISDEAKVPLTERGNNEGNGEVEIAYILDCPCDFLCMYTKFNDVEKEYKCYCPPNYILADDGTTCLSAEKVRKIPKNKMIGIILGSIAGVFAVSILLFLIVHYKNKRKLKALRLEHGYMNNPDYQLDRLRNASASRNMEYNPNYDFGGSTCTIQDLREIPRQHLLLIRALGQGAFGEVYQGFLSNLPPEATEMPVAVKTLPALCTDQAEMDFLMEALIMSKFNHPNIVNFVGVCFEKHPRFIILELLEGGDLKSFLRECRPKHDHPSTLTMLELAHLSLDVAKGCLYLEQNHFIHRDIAARNCLLTTKGTDRIAKIADFGMARDIYRADYYRKGGKAMLPVKWMPPEAFMDGIFTSKTDVWSFGIVLWEVFSLGYMPYPGRGNHEVMQLVTSGGRLDSPHNCPSSIYELMTSCWNSVADNRPDFGTVIEKMHQILEDPEVVHAPLPAFHQQPVCERNMPMMHPLYRDSMDASMKGMEPESTSSLDDLLRPLDADYQHPVSVHQSSSPNNGGVEYVDSFTPNNGGVEYLDSFMHQSRPEQSAEPGSKYTPTGLVSEQLNNVRQTGGAVPKSRKSWNSADINEDESSSLLASELSDTKRISSDFSDSVDSGKSSLDSSKSKHNVCQDVNDREVSFDPDVLMQKEQISEHSPHPQQQEVTRPGSSSPSKASDVNRTHSNGKSRNSQSCKSASPKPAYENFPLGASGFHKASPINHSHPDVHLPHQHGVLDRRPTEKSEKQEKGDSGIEVDLRSIKKSH